MCVPHVLSVEGGGAGAWVIQSQSLGAGPGRPAHLLAHTEDQGAGSVLAGISLGLTVLASQGSIG